MNKLSDNFLEASYRSNRRCPTKTANSTLVHKLKKNKWVPQKGNKFVRPCDASPDRLLNGFPFDNGQKWLAKVEFGASTKKQSEEYDDRNQYARAWASILLRMLRNGRKLLSIRESTG